MKKLLSSICIAMSFTLLTSCGGAINEKNYLSKYTEFKQTFESATSTKTTSDISMVTRASEHEESAVFNVEYIKVKKDDTFDGYAKLSNGNEASSVVIEAFYKDGSLYGKSTTVEDKVKMDIDYATFNTSYNSLYLLDIVDTDVASKELIKNSDGTTSVNMTLKNDKFSSLFENELNNVSSTLSIPLDYLSAEFSDITYNITFDKAGIVSNVDINYETTVTVQISKIVGDKTNTGEPVKDEVVTRTVTINTKIDELNKPTITFPEDLDTYQAV